MTAARTLAVALAAASTAFTALATAAGHAAWTSARASAYSPADSPGRLACTGAPLTWSSRVVAHRTLPCGTRIRLCVASGRCATVLVADRGPAAWTGRDLDLAPGAYRALGYTSARAFGVRTLHYRRLS